MLEMCTFDFFYQQICVINFNWCNVELRYVCNDKVFPIFQTQLPFISRFSLYI